VLESPEVLTDDGQVIHGSVRVAQTGFFRNNPTAAELPKENYSVEKTEQIVRLPAETPADWMKPDFDDSAWARQRGPLLDTTNRSHWKLAQMRATFEVADPAKAGDLTISLVFRGGAVVYLNGEEVARPFMPSGPLDLYTPASPYPDDALFSAEGYAMLRNDHNPNYKDRLASRIRRLDNFKIPADKIRKGVNVLAISNVRSPLPVKYCTRRNVGYPGMHDDCYWAPIGLFSVRLQAPAGSSAVPNTSRLKGQGFTVWTQSVIQKVALADYPEPFAPLRPMHLIGVRNGIFAGQVVVADEKPITGLKVQPSELSGPGTIPVSAVQVRYGVPDGRGSVFDSLEDVAPAEVPVEEENGGSIQPIWLTVAVPADAKPGDYAGTVAISAAGVVRRCRRRRLCRADLRQGHHDHGCRSEDRGAVVQERPRLGHAGMPGFLEDAQRRHHAGAKSPRAGKLAPVRAHGRHSPDEAGDGRHLQRRPQRPLGRPLALPLRQLERLPGGNDDCDLGHRVRAG
jgi:hypothetical protein